MPLSIHGLSKLAVLTASWLAVRYWLSIRPPQTSTPTSPAIRATLLDKHLGFGTGKLRYQYSFCIASGSTNGYKRDIAGAPLPVCRRMSRSIGAPAPSISPNISRKIGRRCESVHTLQARCVLLRQGTPVPALLSRDIGPHFGRYGEPGCAGAGTVAAGSPLSQTISTLATVGHLPRSLHPSKMKVTSMVTRNSSILPFLTLAFCSIT